MPRFYSRSHGTALRIREHAEKGEDAILVLEELKFSRVETKACRQGKNGKLILQTEPGAGHAPEAEETGARRRRAPPWWSERPRGADVPHAPGRGTWARRAASTGTDGPAAASESGPGSDRRRARFPDEV